MAAQDSPLLKCGYCDQHVEGYEYFRTAVIVNGRREFGPETVKVTPCGCECFAPEFVEVDDEVFNGKLYITVAIIDTLNEVDVIEFVDEYDYEECDD